MKVGEQQEYLELLTNSLKENLQAEIPSGEFFQVKCAVKNERLMILIQHLQGVTVDTEKTFTVAEEAINSLNSTKTIQVEVFLRVVAQKLPYAKRDMVIVEEEVPSLVEIEVLDSETKEAKETEDVSNSQSIDDYNQHNQDSWVPAFLKEEDKEEEHFDPLADAPDITHYSTIKHFYPIKYLIIGGGVLAIAMFGLSAYLVTPPCVLSECKPIQIATRLQTPALPLANQNIATTELTKLQTDIEKAIADLKQIPPWSSRHQEVEPLVQKLSAQYEKVGLLLKAFQTAGKAAQKTRASNNLQELQATQELWRQAILPLEPIDRKSVFYDLAHAQISSYRRELQAVKQQLRTEEKWLEKLESAKSVALVAQKRQEAAKSLKELQKAQSTWEVAVNALKIIPSNRLAYKDAQKLLLEYKAKLANASLRTTKEEMANKTYNQAIRAARQAQLYEKRNQWQGALNQWTRAVAAIKQISPGTYYYNTAQPLLPPYNNALQKAQRQLQINSTLRTTFNNLASTCVNDGVQICSFKVSLQGISVQMTAEYEQAIAISNENDAISTASHLQILQQALEVISDNAGIPLAIYDAQGEQFYQHKPRS